MQSQTISKDAAVRDLQSRTTIQGFFNPFNLDLFWRTALSTIDPKSAKTWGIQIIGIPMLKHGTNTMPSLRNYFLLSHKRWTIDHSNSFGIFSKTYTLNFGSWYLCPKSNV